MARENIPDSIRSSTGRLSQWLYDVQGLLQRFNAVQNGVPQEK
jgi:hypothetical protein